MSTLPNRPTASADAALSQSLLDRVIARVNDAGATVDRRANAVRPRAVRRRAEIDVLSAALTRTPEQVREARCLRLVFADLGSTYRRYRRETGAPVSPAVRDAAVRFRKELSVASLASVAGRLDELKILTW